jgi:type IV secretory pathway VirB10-like protein
MPSRSSKARIVAVLFTSGLSLAIAGCARQKVQAAPPVAAPPAPSAAETQRPMNIAPDTNASPPVETIAPPPAIPDSATAPPAVVVPRPKPAKPPKPVTEPPAEQPAEQAAHPPAPQISPQLSPEVQANYERKAKEDLAVAEQNLQQASGRKTSAAQDDLKEKIRRFIDQSRDATKAGDLVRAQNLAQKARLLSIELVESL